MRLGSASLVGALLIVGSAFLAGCPAAFAPTNPIAANRSEDNSSSGNTDGDSGDLSAADPTAPPTDVADGAPATVPVKTETGTDVASNAGTIAAAGDTAEAGKERLTITFRQVRFGHNFQGFLPEPPATRYLSANPHGPTDLPLQVVYRNATGNMNRGYPVGSQIRLIFYPEVITKPTTYVDASPAVAFVPIKVSDGPNIDFQDLNLGKGTLEVYAYENPIYDETGSYTMAHTADYHEGDLIPFADPSQLTDFLGNLHVRHLGTFKVIFGYPTGH